MRPKNRDSIMKNNRSKLGKNNKRKGSNGERRMALVFRNLGYDKCQTTRASSKLLDDCGIDLNFIPVSIQVKVGKQQGMNPVEELKNIQEKLILHLPKDDPWQTKPKAVIHIKHVGKGLKRDEFSDIVTMSLNDFLLLVTKAFPSEGNKLEPELVTKKRKKKKDDNNFDRITETDV